MLVKVTDYRGDKPIKRYVNTAMVTDAVAWTLERHPEAGWNVSRLYGQPVYVSNADMEILSICSESDHG